MVNYAKPKDVVRGLRAERYKSGYCPNNLCGNLHPFWRDVFKCKCKTLFSLVFRLRSCPCMQKSPAVLLLAIFVALILHISLLIHLGPNICTHAVPTATNHHISCLINNICQQQEVYKHPDPNCIASLVLMLGDCLHARASHNLA